MEDVGETAVSQFKWSGWFALTGVVQLLSHLHAVLCCRPHVLQRDHDQFNMDAEPHLQPYPAR